MASQAVEREQEQAPEKEARYDFHLPIKTEANLRLFVKKTFGVTFSDNQVCKDHSTPWRAFCDAFFARHPMQVWKASRGYGGKSFELSTLALTEAITLVADVNLLGGSGEQSKRILEAMTILWDSPNAPTWMMMGTPSLSSMQFTTGNTVKALMASQKSVRGPHPQRLRLDEVDVMKQDLVEAALPQTMDKVKQFAQPDGTLVNYAVKANIVLSSTHQNAKGTMTAMIERMHEAGYPVHTWCYRENLEPYGFVNPDEVARKKTLIEKVMWDTEYEGQEPSPDTRAISPIFVDKMFQKARGHYGGKVGERIVHEPPHKRGLYAVGADWARKKDYTEIIVLRYDCKPARLVAFLKINRAPWPVMVAHFETFIREYDTPHTLGVSAMHDATGIGDVIAGFLKVDAEGFELRGIERSKLLSDYIAAIEHEEMVSPMIDGLYGEHKYASVDDVYSSAEQFHLPDGICAGALAYRAAMGSFKAGFASGD